VDLARRLREEGSKAVRRDSADERIRDDRQVGGTALDGGDLPLDLRFVVQADRDAVRKPLAACTSRDRSEVRVADEQPASCTIPRDDAIRAGARRRPPQGGAAGAVGGHDEREGHRELVQEVPVGTGQPDGDGARPRVRLDPS
jgi:hypothetical protein